MRIRPHRLIRKQREHQCAGPLHGGTAFEHEHFDSEVERGGEGYEGAGDEEEGFEGTDFALEAGEKGGEGEGVEEEVEDGGVDEGVGVEAMHLVG